MYMHYCGKNNTCTLYNIQSTYSITVNTFVTHNLYYTVGGLEFQTIEGVGSISGHHLSDGKVENTRHYVV